MGLDDDASYLALRSRDARFDGRLFVGVTTTGIYCRPVCRVRTPQRRHCRFFTRAAQAEQAGFRPCLRCRPELAPGLSLVDSAHALAAQAALALEHAARAGDDLYVGELARRLGITERHLRRIFVQAHGVSPLEYLTTQRLLLAKQLLTDTPMPVTEVALASGFASLRRFHAAFAARYRLQPSALRRAGAGPAGGGDALVVRLGYRPPYDVSGTLRFLAARAVPGLEAVESGDDRAGLWRSLAVVHRGRRLEGWVGAQFRADRHEAVVHVAPALAPALGPVIESLRQGLDLDADPAQIAPALAQLPQPAAAGLRVVGGFDGFEAAVRVVLAQQVSVAAARTLTRRLVEALGRPLAAAPAGLARLFPDAQAIADASPAVLGALGIVRQRVAALQALARAVLDGRLALHRGAPLAPTLTALRDLPGLGDWSAQLIAMRALGWPDAFPADDHGVLAALRTRSPAVALDLSHAWRPWRSYAVAGLWQSLEARR